jgi:hypothetical protein
MKVVLNLGVPEEFRYIPSVVLTGVMSDADCKVMHLHEGLSF